MISQNTRAQISPEMRQKVIKIYWITNWCARIGFGALCLVFCSWLIRDVGYLPEIVGRFIGASAIIMAFWLGNLCAIKRLKLLGFFTGAKETRTIIARTKPQFAKYPPRRNFIFEYKAPLFFALMWLVAFLVFGLTSGGFGNQEDVPIYALAALIFAVFAFIIIGYLFPKSQLIQSFKQLFKNTWGMVDSDYLKFVPWPQINKIKEEKSWDFKGDMTECRFLFFRERDVLCQRIYVPPEHYEAVYHQIAARLEDARIESHSLS